MASSWKSVDNRSTLATLLLPALLVMATLYLSPSRHSISTSIVFEQPGSEALPLAAIDDFPGLCKTEPLLNALANSALQREIL
jgi:hypothetical protein